MCPVLGVYRVEPASTLALVVGLPREGMPRRRVRDDSARSIRGPDDLCRGVDQGTKLLFALADLLLDLFERCDVNKGEDHAVDVIHGRAVGRKPHEIGMAVVPLYLTLDRHAVFP